MAPSKIDRVGRWAHEIWHEPPPDEVVEGVVWSERVTVLVAESGAGKTFVLLDVAAAVSADLPWHGRSTFGGSVAYCSYEGDAFGVRLRAMNLHSGHRFAHLAVIRLSDPISPVTGFDGVDEQPSRGERQLVQEIEALQDDILTEGYPPLRLIVIDTVRASMTGNENGSDTTAAYVRVVRRLLARVPTAGCILAHHAGWQDGEKPTKRERGSSAWRGNVDATLYLEAGEFDSTAGTAPLTLSALKVRDSERPPPLHLVRRRVTLNESDVRGQPLTSCVIDRDRRTNEEQAADAQAQAAQTEHRLDLKTLQVLAKRSTVATSQDQLRQLVGGKRDHVYASLTRLLEHAWVEIPERQRQPYRITTLGLEVLNGGDG